MTTLGRIGGLVRMLNGMMVMATAFLLLVASGLLTQGHLSAAPERRDTRRAFYLSRTGHDGGQALAACAAGFHMASMWEILDPSQLRYHTALGLTDADSGEGPPSIKFGWIRTGRFPSNVQLPGAGNCNVWTSTSNDDYGTMVGLRGQWVGLESNLSIDPWSATATGCFSTAPVWCVED